MNAKERVAKFDEYFADASRGREALERQRGSLAGVDALRAWWTSVEAYEDRYAKLKSYTLRRRMPSAYVARLGDLEQNVRQLPWIPRIELVSWMQTLRDFSNLAVLEVDTCRCAKDGSVEIIRCLVMDGTGNVLFDHYLHPEQMTSEGASSYAGVTAGDLDDAPIATQVWPELLVALSGKYVVATDIERVQIQLLITAKRYRLAVPALVGQSILQLCRAYFSEGRYDDRSSHQRADPDELAVLCKKVGFPLPAQQYRTALDRATGLLLLMRAMSEGFPYNNTPTIGMPKVLQEDSDSLEE